MRTSHSEIAMYLTCPRKHHHVYRDRRVSRVTPAALATGRRVDEALKTSDTSQLPPLERALVDGYRMRWRDPLPITGEGVWFEVQLRDDVTIMGQFDAVTDDAIIERKTTSEDISSTSLFWHRFLKLDPQVTMYLLARPRAKYVLVDALRKLAIRPRKDESNDDLYCRALETVGEDLDRYYQRTMIVRSKAEHAAHVRDILGVVRLIQYSDDAASYGNMPPRNPRACMNFGKPCEYLPVCSNETTIRDELRYKNKERSNV